MGGGEPPGSLSTKSLSLSAAPAFLSARALPAGTGDVRPGGANPSSLSAHRDEIPVREVSETTGDGLIGLNSW